MDAKELKNMLRNAREAIRRKEYQEALKNCKEVLEVDRNNYMALVLIGVAYDELEQHEQAVKSYKQAIETDSTQILAWQGLCSFFEKVQNPSYTADLLECYFKLEGFYNGDPEKRMEIIHKLGKVIGVNKDQKNIEKWTSEDTLNMSSALCRRYPHSLLALEYAVIAEMDQQIGLQQFCMTPALEETMRLVTHQPCHVISSILLVMQGFEALCKGDYAAASQMLLKVSDPIVLVPYLLAVIEMNLHHIDLALQHCQTALKMVERKEKILTISKEKTTQSLLLIRVVALCKIGDQASIEAASQIVDNVLEKKDERSILVAGHVYMKHGDFDKAKACLVGESVQRLELEGLLAFHGQDLELAADKFQLTIEKEPEQSRHYVNLAKCLLGKTDRKQECFTLLLKAAKLDPYNSEIFLYLGHNYSSDANDISRQRKCYQKAFDLNPSSNEAGTALCDVLILEGMEERVHEILHDVTSKASPGCAKWAWLRLGLYQIKHDDCNAAIASFQSALRADHQDKHVWECLGEAYLARGSYTASLKTFQRASELDVDSMYCLFQMASIKQTLSIYTEAIEEYTRILQISDNYVPALKGLGECCILVAKSLLTKGFLARARDKAEMALIHLTKASSLRPDLSCVWKLMGDACTIVHVLPAETFLFQKPDKEILSKLQCLELGARYYIRALKIYQECSSLWHDLGFNYIHQSLCSTGVAAISLAEKSMQALKKAIQLEPTNHRHWNVLGYVACLPVCYQPSLAQHCFIKSIANEDKNVVAWTNLASLYLKHGNIKLAHEAYKIAQNLEPSYVACWIGQAIIAEVVNHADAMDLFRHTTELGVHIESALGYGHWVCMMLGNKEKHDSVTYMYAIEQMGALPTASDALAKYTEQVKTNPIAYNMHGLLLERQSLYITAAQQLKCAKELLEGTDCKDSVLTDVYCNYARVVCKTGDYKTACEIYNKIGDVNKFEDLCQMGLAFYKADDLDTSYKVYTKALEIAETELDKSHVYSAMAMILYKAGDLDNAKTTLFYSSQLPETSQATLKALCALGLTQNDMNLTNAAMIELMKSADTDLYDVALLYITLCAKQGNMTEVKIHLQRYLHKDPSQAKLWSLLSTILNMYYSGLELASSTCARAAVVMGGMNKTLYSLMTTGELKSGCHGNDASSHDAFSTAQRAVHYYPDHEENWINLISAIHAKAILARDQCVREDLFKQEYNMLTYFIEKGTISVTVRLWCHKQRVLCTMYGNLHGMMDCLDQLLTEFGMDIEVKQFFKVSKNVIEGNSSGLLSVLNTESPQYYWQILLDMYISQDQIDEAQAVFQGLLSSTSDKCVQLMWILWFVNGIFQISQTGKADIEQHREVLLHYLQSMPSADTNCTILYLLQGLLNLHVVKTRLVKHQLQKVLHYNIAGDRGYDITLAQQAINYILMLSDKDVKG